MASFFDRFYKDVGIDLGTANTLIYVRDRGLAVNEPSVAAVNNKTNQILAVGEDAKKMLGRTPGHITVVRPLVNGVISDFEMTREMLRQFLRRLTTTIAPLASYRRGILAIPNNLTEVERKSAEDAAIAAGCAKAFLVEQPIAAALGANLPIDTPTASLVIDIGGGTTDIAVISMGGTVNARTLKTAGDKFNQDIIQFVRDEFKLVIGEPTAEFAKMAVGSAIPLDKALEVPIRGRDMATGLPREVVIKNSHVRSALSKSLRTMSDAVLETIETTPPELVGDMLKQGVLLCGGGALLRGVDVMIEKDTGGVTVQIAEDPLTCVVRGLGRMVDEFDDHRTLLDNPLRPLEVAL
jgi:rod shape-determining protein MreB